MLSLHKHTYIILSLLLLRVTSDYRTARASRERKRGDYKIRKITEPEDALVSIMFYTKNILDFLFFTNLLIFTYINYMSSVLPFF